MGRTQTGRAPDLATGTFDFDGASLAAAASAEQCRELAPEQIAEVRNRCEARFGLGVACYPVGSEDAAHSKSFAELRRVLIERDADPLFAPPLGNANLERYSGLKAATDGLTAVDTEIRSRLEFFQKCWANSADLKERSAHHLAQIQHQRARYDSGQPAYLSAAEQQLINDLWMQRDELEAGWTQQHEEQVAALVREFGLRLGHSGFVWVDKNGYWEPKLEQSRGRYKNSTLLELLNPHYFVGFSKYTTNGDRQFVVNAAKTLLNVLWPVNKESKKRERAILTPEQEAKAKQDFLSPLYKKWPPPPR